MATSKLKLSEAISEYMNFVRATDCTTATVDGKRGLLRRFEMHIGDRRVVSVTAQQVEDFFYGPKGIGQHTMASTFNQQLGTVVAFEKWLHRRRYIRVDWLLGVKRKPVHAKERLRLSARELLALPSFADTDRDRAMIAMACNIPARSSDLVSMRVADVRLDDGVVRLTVKKTHQVKEKDLSSDLDAVLRRWLRQYGDSVGGLSAEYYLFPSRGPRLPIWERDENGVQRMVGHRDAILRPTTVMTHPHKVVQIALRRAGFSASEQGFHTIRRSVARAYYDALIERGHDGALRVVMDWLDHKSSATTERYIGVTTEQAINRRLIRGKPFLSAMVDESNVTPLHALS